MKLMERLKKDKKGFTLIEMIVVIVIITLVEFCHEPLKRIFEVDDGLLCLLLLFQV